MSPLKAEPARNREKKRSGGNHAYVHRAHRVHCRSCVRAAAVLPPAIIIRVQKERSEFRSERTSLLIRIEIRSVKGCAKIVLLSSAHARAERIMQAAGSAGI